MAKKVLVVLGHPSSNSYCSALADAYADGARESGAEVETLRLGDLEFDPILHNGYQKVQTLEPDLVRAQELVTWAEHLVFVYPIWWGTMPALLKGFFDRVFLPGFAFKYRDGSQFWDKLLAGRSGRIIATLDAPSWYNWLVYSNASQKAMKRATLQFCGIKPVGVTTIGSIKGSKPERLAREIESVKSLGKGLR